MSRTYPLSPLAAACQGGACIQGSRLAFPDDAPPLFSTTRGTPKATCIHHIFFGGA